MTFDEVLAQVRELLQREQRVSYRGLKRRFALDDEYLEDLKEELIGAKRLATDEDGRFLVWAGAAPVLSSESRVLIPSQPPAPNTQPPAERRQLTVMFCDLVGSTALSSRLDPEELREVVRRYQDICAATIRRYDGYIAQHLGDGLLAYFGYPTAHEDDAAHAVRAGLEIVAALQQSSSRHDVPSPFQGEGQGEGRVTTQSSSPHPHLLPGGEKEFRSLRVRIGIHTGLVVIGEIGSSEKREVLALGETPNLAARIQGQAQPDEVMVSAATYRLIEGMFVAEERGQPELKGVASPQTLYRVVKESEAHSRFEVVVRQGLTPLVGREHELGLLRERWNRAKDGSGQVVLLSGEPGIGKSRLVEALKEHVGHEGARFLELRCSPYAQNSALAPVIEHLQRALELRPEDSAEEKLRKLERDLEGRGEVTSPLRGEMIVLFAGLLALPHPDGYPPLTFSPQKQKEKTYEALVTWLSAEAAVALANDLRFPPVLAMGTIMRGWALAEQGQGEQGIEQIRQGCTAWQTMGGDIQRPYSLALLAEAHVKMGRIEEGLAVLAEALDMAKTIGTYWWEAELYRLRGEILLIKAREQETRSGQRERVTGP